MVELYEDDLANGTWLRLEDDGRLVLGAYVDFLPATGSPFTIAWLGDPAPAQILDFIKAIYPTLDVGDSGQMVLTGRAFASGVLSKFTGSDWLKAATIPKAAFVRFDCRAERRVAAPGAGRSLIAEEVILWARLNGNSNAQKDDESVGVKLPLSHLGVLEDRLATFIASSQVNQPHIETVREALRQLGEHLTPKATPLAAE